MTDENSDTDGPYRTTDLKVQDALPVTAVGIESQRERKNFSDLPPQNYVHTWFARRPTAATRLSILASILPKGYDENELMRLIGMKPSNLLDLPDKTKSIADHVVEKKAEKEQEGIDGRVYDHYGYRKAYKNPPSAEEIDRLHETLTETWGRVPTIMDATAGGGAIPLESVRYGLETHANELNGVAVAILHGVLEAPYTGKNLSDDIRTYGERINEQVRENIGDLFPDGDDESWLERIWAHTVKCPNCGVDLPLSPNWWLDKDKGIAARPLYDSNENKEATPEVSFEIVDVNETDFEPTDGTVTDGDASCYCDWTIESDEIKDQARDECLGDQVFAIHTEDDDGRGFTSPDELEKEAVTEAREAVQAGGQEIRTLLNTDIPKGEETERLHPLGISEWRDMYTDRQLLTHYHYWKAFEQIKPEVREEYDEDEAKAILTYIAFAADKSATMNCKQSWWEAGTPKVAQIFDRHDFAFKWSFAEINLTSKDLGYGWVLESIIEAYEEFRELSSGKMGDAKVTQSDARQLNHLDDGEIDVLVVDPPYYQNVMYSELSDFFYVWLRKYLGDVYPGQFDRDLTNKDDEAVANASQFDADSDESKRELAKQDYKRKMGRIFEELHRVLADDGVFTLMFTHKQADAWDSLTKALIDAGFKVTATHPVNTEAPLALNQAGKNAAESTIFLTSEARDATDTTPSLWENVRKKARERAYETAADYEKQRQRNGDSDEFGDYVALTVAVYGPTLEVLTENAPVKTATGEDIEPKRALDEARNAITEYIVDNYMTDEVKHVGAKDRWYLILWLAFGTRTAPMSEAQKLAQSMGVNIDDLKKDDRLWRKNDKDSIRLRPFSDRIHAPDAEGRIYEPIDASQMQFDSVLDAVHATLWWYENHGVDRAQKFINARNLQSDSTYRAVLEELANLLPTRPEDSFQDGAVIKELLTSRLTSPGGPLDSINVTFSDVTAEGTTQQTLEETPEAEQDDD
ncbi:DUF1156 domain-containing protein [Halobacterium salinarum]|uniref:DUF1156 domain-containing protein n=1 Tax=Halobacterium salinarum TaxID=2242 RepID=UPI0025533197|nr:DUF1156 domain-containing protein [Halobacterium salinarum]MDL0145564.1 DUF1156 domain-containing protein [Halobacterium salinarum]